MNNIETQLAKLAVLVVDDMEAIRSAVVACLQDLGITRHHTATNGNDAWNYLQNGKVDLIVCDWDMPQMSGIELLKLVRGSEAHRHLPFLMLTATTDKKSVVAAVDAGVSDYLSKPFQPKELEYRVIKLLRKVKQENPDSP